MKTRIYAAPAVKGLTHHISAWDVTLITTIISPVNTKQLYNICTMLDQSRKRWADVVHMLYKCSVFVGSPCDVGRMILKWVMP